jgi:hypothetical protein
MLWHKGWLETRFRLLFTLGFTTAVLVLQYSVRNAAPPPGAKSPAFGLVMVASPIQVLMACALLGGAGIVTQPSFQATKGLHGSTLFTLSLPVVGSGYWRSGPVSDGWNRSSSLERFAAECGLYLRRSGRWRRRLRCWSMRER